MLDTPQILETAALLTAVIRMTIPREEIQQVMGPAIAEVMAALRAEGIAPAGPVFSHHFRMAPDIFDFEVGVPVAAPVTPVGRVRGAELRAARVARRVYRGGYEGLGPAWGEFMAWIEAKGLRPAEDLWEFYTLGPESSPDPAAWCTELNRPLAADATPEEKT
jgi:effector-binding domain-containing protein